PRDSQARQWGPDAAQIRTIEDVGFAVLPEGEHQGPTSRGAEDDRPGPAEISVAGVQVRPVRRGEVVAARPAEGGAGLTAAHRLAVLPARCRHRVPGGDVERGAVGSDPAGGPHASAARAGRPPRDACSGGAQRYPHDPTMIVAAVSEVAA